MEEQEFKEMKQKLDDTHRLVYKLYRFERRRQIFRLLKFVILIVIIVGAYYALSPVFTRVLDTYSSFSSGVSDIQNFKFPFGNKAPEAE